MFIILWNKVFIYLKKMEGELIKLSGSIQNSNKPYWTKSCFILIPWVDCNLVITIVEVNATKTVSINQLVQQIMNSKVWILVRLIY